MCQVKHAVVPATRRFCTSCRLSVLPSTFISRDLSLYKSYLFAMDRHRRPPSTSYTAQSAVRDYPASSTSRTGYCRSTSISTSNPFHTTNGYTTATGSRPRTVRPSTGRPGTARPRTGMSTLGIENQEIICAVSESRGVSPSVGMAFLNLDTGEAVLSQFSDSQTYVRTVHKVSVVHTARGLTLIRPAMRIQSLYYSCCRIVSESQVEAVFDHGRLYSR